MFNISRVSRKRDVCHILVKIELSIPNCLEKPVFSHVKILLMDHAPFQRKQSCMSHTKRNENAQERCMSIFWTYTFLAPHSLGCMSIFCGHTSFLHYTSMVVSPFMWTYIYIAQKINNLVQSIMDLHLLCIAHYVC